MPVDNRHSAFHRWFPFAVFMGFIGLGEVLNSLAAHGIIKLAPADLLFLYPVRAIAVGLILISFRRYYAEIHLPDLAQIENLALSVGVGVVVFVLWINMDWPLSAGEASVRFDPTLVSDNFTRMLLLVCRTIGAVLVVPVMEELFWRSWLLRYIIDHDFSRIQIGTYTWSSFIICTLLFGFEHNYIYAGIVAGIAYNLLLYYTKSISVCILSHAVTNLALAIYVIGTKTWSFW